GGGKALDVAKYTASLAGLPYFAAPTSLSNDGFCSPQASLTLEGKRRSLLTGLPEGVVVDLAVCQRAPLTLWHSGVSYLGSKFTAVSDCKLAFHRRGVPVNDLAALISDASVFQFRARPRLHGLQTGTAAYLVSSLQGGSRHFQKYRRSCERRK